MAAGASVALDGAGLGRGLGSIFTGSRGLGKEVIGFDISTNLGASCFVMAVSGGVFVGDFGTEGESVFRTLGNVAAPGLAERLDDSGILGVGSAGFFAAVTRLAAATGAGVLSAVAETSELGFILASAGFVIDVPET